MFRGLVYSAVWLVIVTFFEFGVGLGLLAFSVFPFLLY